MNALHRFAVTGFVFSLMAIPSPALAGSPNAGGTSFKTTGPTAFAHLARQDGCILTDLFIHSLGGTFPGTDASVDQIDTCTNSTLEVAGGTDFAYAPQVDKSLKSASATDSITMYSKYNNPPSTATFDLTWTGVGAVQTFAEAPGQAGAGSGGYHLTTPYFNVTVNGELSLRTATVSGTASALGLSFGPADLVYAEIASSNGTFVFVIKP